MFISMSTCAHFVEAIVTAVRVMKQMPKGTTGVVCLDSWAGSLFS